MLVYDKRYLPINNYQLVVGMIVNEKIGGNRFVRAMEILMFSSSTDFCFVLFFYSLNRIQ